MKTAIGILTLAETIPVILLAQVLLAMHLIAAIIGTRTGQSDFFVSIAKGDSSCLISTHTLPFCFILAGGGLLLFGVWRLLQK